jgi:hypothetical protein
MASDLKYPNGLVYGKFLRELRVTDTCPRCQFKEDKYIIENNNIYKRVDAFGNKD